jgi:hypothetical protein
MSELVVPEFDLEFYKQSCIPIPEGQPEYAIALRSTRRYLDSHYEDHIASIENFEMNKPGWLREAEVDARRFMGSLAFDDLPPIVLLRSNSIYQFDSSPPAGETLAIWDAELGVILLGHSGLKKMYGKHGSVGVGATLAHELGHATVPSIDRVGVHLRTRDPRQAEYVYGWGWHVGTDTNPKGRFFEEAFAEFLAGWYARIRQTGGSPSPLISFQGKPDRHLPEHYQYTVSDDPIAGPDGYTLELLAYGLRKRHILSVDDFVCTMFETRRSETSLQARRTFAQAVDQLSPGLYPYLRNLAYSRENWQEACDVVYSLVTRR